MCVVAVAQCGLWSILLSFFCRVCCGSIERYAFVYGGLCYGGGFCGGGVTAWRGWLVVYLG